MTEKTFSVQKINKLRKLAEEARRLPPIKEIPIGWSISKADPMKLLEVFKTLRIKDGFVLRAYQLRDGVNGFGHVYALPENAPFPEPKKEPDLKRKLELLWEGFGFGPSAPPDALENKMEIIELDGTPWSYMEASLLCRELYEFGGMWQGSFWETNIMLSTNPLAPKNRSRADGPMFWPTVDPKLWEWLEPKPRKWKPRVCEEGDKVQVLFYTYSGHCQQFIFKHFDVYQKGGGQLEFNETEIAQGPDGFMF